MTSLREAATQALEALQDLGMRYFENTGEVRHRPIFEALKAALAEKALHIDTLRIAREAGFAVEDGGVYTPDAYGPGDVTQLVKRFAALVADAEREACAKMCEEFPYDCLGCLDDCAAAIRARGDK